MNLVALPEVAKLIMGQSPASSSYNTRGEGLPFFQGKADFGDIFPTVRVWCTEPNKIAEANDILISVRAPVGPTNINTEKACIGRGLAAIRHSEQIELKYLFYFLRFYEPQLARLGTGSTFEAISRDDLESVKIPLPPLPEQQRIAARLDKADRLRRLRRYALDLGETYLQSVFLEMFGDPVRNEKGWPIIPLEDVILSTKNGFGKRADFSDSGTIVLRIREVGAGYIDYSEPRRIGMSSDEIDDYHLENGDVLLVRVNGNPDLVGRAALFEVIGEPVAFNDHIIRVKIDPEAVNPVFLVHSLNNEYGRSQVRSVVTTTAGQFTINHGGITRVALPFPPLALQEKFAGVVRQYDRLRAQQRESLRQVAHLFQTLLHRAFEDQV